MLSLIDGAQWLECVASSDGNALHRSDPGGDRPRNHQVIGVWRQSLPGLFWGPGEPGLAIGLLEDRRHSMLRVVDGADQVVGRQSDMRDRFDPLAGIRLGRIPERGKGKDGLIVGGDVERNLGLSVSLDLPLIKLCGDLQAPLPALPWTA
jgi:hypothetical protein